MSTTNSDSNGLWDVSVVTLNCARDFPFRDQQEKLAILKELITFNSNNAQDIYAFGFQELVRIWEGAGKIRMEAALIDILKDILDILDELFPQNNYKKLGYSDVGATAVLVVGKETIECHDSASTTSNCGKFGSTLKGGTAYSFRLKKNESTVLQTFTFISCHLNANEGEDNMTSRINDYDRIMTQCNRDFSDLEFRKGHIFVFGDLNFRVNDPNFKAHIASEWEPTLRKHEELNHLRAKHVIFRGFDEQPVTFPPTYKYKVGDMISYNNKRIPSWCDRILYKKYPSGLPMGKARYESLERVRHMQFTDHQAVGLAIQVPDLTKDNKHELELIRLLEPLNETLGYFADTLLAYEWLRRSTPVYILAALILFYFFYNLL